MYDGGISTVHGEQHEISTRSGGRGQATHRGSSLDRAEQAVREADLVLDVREPDEYAAGHLPGAVSVPRGLLEFKLSATPAMTPRDLKVVVYCKSGGRAALAAASMKDMGYLQVVSLVGGFDGWQSAGYPVVRPEQPAFD
jgi:rhodanese-related sulfurtransferase